jgi:uncharacterized damage-inducible protein DinB
MPHIETYCQQNLLQLSLLLKAMTPENYLAKLPILSDSSIGQHVRHLLEFYQCLLNQSGSGKVNYDLRKRDLTLEEDLNVAIGAMEQLISELNTRSSRAEKLILENDFSNEGLPEIDRIFTSYERELAYCLEHAIHHQALIKVGLHVLGLKHLADQSFGLAPATIRYQNSPTG